MRRLQVAKMAKSEVYCQLPPSVNVNGVIDRNRFRQVLTQIHTNGVSVLTLQETGVDKSALLTA